MSNCPLASDATAPSLGAVPTGPPILILGQTTDPARGGQTARSDLTHIGGDVTQVGGFHRPVPSSLQTPLSSEPTSTTTVHSVALARASSPWEVGQYSLQWRVSDSASIRTVGVHAPRSASHWPTACAQRSGASTGSRWPTLSMAWGVQFGRRACCLSDVGSTSGSSLPHSTSTGIRTESNASFVRR